MNRIYPYGAIRSYKELCKLCNISTVNNEIYSASRRFKMINNNSLYSLTIAKLMDSNIPPNGYNDWFLFADEAKAKAYAGIE